MSCFSCSIVRLVIVLAVSLTAVSCAGVRNKLPSPLASEVDHYIEELAHLNEVPGMAVAVIRNGNVVVEKYLGVASLETQAPVTEKTVFRLYSTSKLMTAVAVFELIEEGRLGLDVSVVELIEGLPDDWAAVTVAHLLAHASGLPDVRSLTSELSDDELSDEGFFNLVFPLERQFSTGEGWSYNQTNYLLLKRIVEVVTGEAFEHYLRNKAFADVPLGRKIFSSNDYEVIANRAMNYRFVREAGSYKRKLENFGKRNNVLAGLNLTLNELAGWSRQLGEGRFIDDRTKSVMWTRFAFANPNENFLHGWGVYPVADQVSYGFTGGGVTGLRVFPDHDLAIIVFTNGYKYYSVHNTVINHVAGMIVPELENKPVALARSYQHAFLKGEVLDVGALYDRTELKSREVAAEDVMTSFAYKLLDIDEPQRALEVFDEIAVRHPASFEALENLGHARLGQAKKVEALVAFEAALALAPGNVGLGELIERIRQSLGHMPPGQ